MNLPRSGARGLSFLTAAGSTSKLCSRPQRANLCSNVRGRDGHASTTCSLESGIRINKCFKERFSRREADRLVEQGRVSVNGNTVSSAGLRVQRGDVVHLDGAPVDWEPLADIDDSMRRPDASEVASQLVYIKYWKPKGVVCTTDRSIPGNIAAEVQVEEEEGQVRIFPVGRLDKESTGLILLTNDGRLVNRALRSHFEHEKVYEVVSDVRMKEEDLERMRNGVVIRTFAQRDSGVRKEIRSLTKKCIVERISGRSIRIVLREGRNRQIRKMLGVLGYTARAIHRVNFLGIDLDGLDDEGDWCHLDGREMGVISRVLERPELDRSSSSPLTPTEDPTSEEVDSFSMTPFGVSLDKSPDLSTMVQH